MFSLKKDVSVTDITVTGIILALPLLISNSLLILLMKKGPHTKPDKLRGGLCHGLKNSRGLKLTTGDDLKLKLFN